jgi:hypothetical protein
MKDDRNVLKSQMEVYISEKQREKCKVDCTVVYFSLILKLESDLGM